LPIVPRDQAKAKLTLMFTVLTSAVILPSLFYVNSQYFIVILANFLYTLPLAWLVLIVLFLLKIKFFGKKRKNMYVLEDYNPKYRISKWLLIISVPYLIIFFLFSIFFLLFAFQDVNSMTVLFWMVIIVGDMYLYILFNRLLPNHNKNKTRK